MTRVLRLLVFVGAWWLGLLGFWMVLVGTNAGLELVAGACAAGIATVFAAGLRHQRLLRFRFEAVWLVRTVRVPWAIVRELAVVSWALVLHLAGAREVRSAYGTLPFPAGRSDAVSAGRRAVVTTADGTSPNTVPIDMNCKEGVLLRHALVPRRASRRVP